MTEYQQMLERVKTFFSAKLGINKSDLSERTKIEEDGGIGSLDTYTFYEEYFAEFHIANSEDFVVRDYIMSENLQLGWLLKSLFLSKKQRQKLGPKDNTLKHLAEVAVAGKWFEPN